MRNLLLILLFLGTINCSNKQESSENKIKIALIYALFICSPILIIFIYSLIKKK